MCFSKEFSFLNFTILSYYGHYLQTNSVDKDIWRLFFPLYFLGLKDLFQVFLYLFNHNDYYKYIFSILSYIHICFQPLFVNILFSYFSKSTVFFNINYWYMIFNALFVFGLYQLTNLDVFDVNNDGLYCKDKTSDFCSDKNSSYIGKYHVGYKFKTKYKYSIFFIIFMIVPALFTKSYILSIIWLFFIILIFLLFSKLRDGERGAIWCMLSIIPTIPVIYYREYITNYINKIK